MLKSIMLTAMALLGEYAIAQDFSVTGTVSDGKTHLALAGATVQLENFNWFSITDEFGKFQLEKVKAGNYSLIIKFLGYEDRVEKVSVNSNTELSIELQESVQITDEVVVYSTRANEKTPTVFTNVSRQMLQKQNFGQDLPFLLNWTPSLVTTSDAGAGIGYTGLRIRGSDATRINVTINGIPYNDSESQGTYWVDIPDVASSTQSIQVQRGVGTSTNGAGAFGGSVNLQTNSLQADPYSEMLLATGSFNSQRYTMRTGTGLINGKWAFDGKVSKIKSDGYVERASSDLGSYYLSGGFYGKKTVVKAITFGGKEKTYQSWYGLDGPMMNINRRFNYAGAIYDTDYNVIRYYENQVDDYRQDHYQLHFSQKLSDYWNVNVSFHYTYGRGFYEEYHQGELLSNLGLADYTIGDTTITAMDVVVQKWLDNKFYGTVFSFNYDKNKTNLTIGGALNRFGNATHFGRVIWAQFAEPIPTNYQYYFGKSQKDDFNIYAKWNYELTSALNAFADVQYRYVDYQTKGTDADLVPYDIADTFNFFNPKAGFSYTLSKGNVLYASYAIANREPNRTDYVDGTVKPKSERLGDFEIGFRKNASRYNFEANYYLMNYKNQLVLTGSLDNVGNPIRANVGKSYRTGIELSGSARLTDVLTWNANVTWSQNKNQDYVNENNLDEKKNTSIVLSPDWIAGSQLTWTAFKNFQTSLLSKYVGKQYLDNTENKSLTLNSYFINDLRLNYSFALQRMKELSISILVNNIFDVKYSSNGYSYSGTAYYYPQAGRNFMTMVAFRF